MFGNEFNKILDMFEIINKLKIGQGFDEE